MRALAEFVMRGRGQAILVAVLGMLLPFCAWIGAAAVGLVTLRKGYREGFLVLSWAALAALFMFLWGGDVGPLTALAGTAVAALVLRGTVSWPYALTAATLAGLLAGLLLHTLGSGYVERLLALMQQAFAQFFAQVQAQDPQLAELGKLTAVKISGLLAVRTVCATVAAVLLARWWQAALYNPGGFRTEFHALRLPLPLAVGLAGAGLLAAAPGPEYHTWALCFAVPLVVSGLALLHGVVGLRGSGRGLLIALYVAWLPLLGVVTLALSLAAVVDSALDFRGRLRRRNSH